MRYIWIILGALSVLIRWILDGHPDIIEQYYTRGLFVMIRYVIDYSVALLPVASIYFFVPALLIILGIKIGRFFKKRANWKQKLIDGVLGMLSFIGGGIFFFLLLWGFNYGRLPIEQQLGISPQPLSLEELKEELDIATADLIEYRAAIPNATDAAISEQLVPQQLESLLREHLCDWLQEHDFLTPGRMRGRILYPKGTFLYFSSSGLYFPFTGEGHVDAGLLKVQQPFVLSHELSHGYGFTDEGTCNFIAYLSCIHSGNPVFQYSGQLAYYRYLASSYLAYKPEEYQTFRANLPLGIQADLNAINDNLAKYPDLLPKLRYYAYDTYLKTQGISEGMKNYSRIIMLGRAWRLRSYE